eukprot:UN25550
MEVPSFNPESSDWTRMPPVLPDLGLNVAPQPLTREKSDWTKMPALLPPLNQSSLKRLRIGARCQSFCHR